MKRSVYFVFIASTFSCVPAIDYEKAEMYPIYIEDVKIEEVKLKSGGFVKGDFVIKNTAGRECQLLCVEYGVGRRIEKSCTKMGKYPPFKSVVIGTLAPKINKPYNAWCYTNVVPLK